MLPGEAGTVGGLRVGAYQAQDHLAASPGYADTLRALGLDPGTRLDPPFLASLS